MRRSSSLLTSGRRRTPRTTLKIAALAPMPSARVRMTVVASPFTRANDRNANLKSVMRLIMTRRLRVREIDTSEEIFSWLELLSSDVPSRQRGEQLSELVVALGRAVLHAGLDHRLANLPRRVTDRGRQRRS